MVTKETCGDLTWIDMDSPTKEDIRLLVKEYSIHPLVAEELLSPTVRPKVDVYDNLIYLILHFPTISRPHGGAQEQEIDFIVGKKFFVTVHYGAIDSLTSSSKRFNINALLKKCEDGEHGGLLFFYLIKELYEDLVYDLEAVGKELEKIENNIFRGKEHQMVRHISEVNRTLLHFKKATSQHKHVLESFERAGERFFGKDFGYYLHSIVGEYYKVASLLEISNDVLRELKATNDSLLTTKTNDVMKALTVMAFIMLPLTLFTSLFSINTDYLPLVAKENSFWLIVGGMIILASVLLSYFKYKKWL